MLCDSFIDYFVIKVLLWFPPLSLIPRRICLLRCFLSLEPTLFKFLILGLWLSCSLLSKCSLYACDFCFFICTGGGGTVLRLNILIGNGRVASYLLYLLNGIQIDRACAVLEEMNAEWGWHLQWTFVFDTVVWDLDVEMRPETAATLPLHIWARKLTQDSLSLRIILLDGFESISCQWILTLQTLCPKKLLCLEIEWTVWLFVLLA